MKKRRIALLFSVLSVVLCSAQRQTATVFRQHSNTLEAYSFSLSVNDFEVINQGGYAKIVTPEGFTTLQQAGKPELPMFQKIIALPQNSEPVLNYSVNGVVIKALGEQKLHPCQPHQFKNREQEFAIDYEVYNSHVFALPTAQIAEIGLLHGIRLLRIIVSPFEYNPQKNELLLHSNIDVEVSLRNADIDATAYQLGSNNGLPKYAAIANRAAFEGLMANHPQLPPKYVIVAQDTFRSALQPFVQWKRQKGFNVVEVYTQGGDTCTLIRSRLDSIYRASTPLDPAPTFVTIVGDVEHVPAFGGKIRITGIGRHITDLYYAEYTGDFYPEAAYGRISVADTAELANVLRKIMDYEQYRFSDTAFLNRVTLVAGYESRTPAPTVTNGQINYLKNTYFSQNPTFDTHYYYNPASDSQLPQIVGDLNL
ncbi:MAG: hypothetical protein J5605_01645, partial [Bacteroidales bacterium]|nr:hypothetical protein [Bacteroidales bacterium]